MSIEQSSSAKTVEWDSPVTARELMEDFNGYTQWLLEEGLAIREDNLVKPAAGKELWRSDLIIRYRESGDEIANISVSDTTPVGHNRYQIAFKYTPNLIVAEFKLSSWERNGYECEDDWFFSRIQISPADAEFLAYMNAFSNTLERRSGLLLNDLG